MSGLQLVKETFSNAKKRACLMPYFPVGYPDLSTSLNVMEAMAKAGADAIEVGVPFSDPLADGPTIQAATQVALENGITLKDCVQAVHELRQRGVRIPLMLMSYFNPIVAYGLEAFVRDSSDAGASGFIVPDLPADEAGEFQKLTEQYEMAFAHFLAPTSSEARIKLAASMARGFIYLVSVTGVTGERDLVPDDLKTFIQRVRRYASQPLAVGFGIGTPEKAGVVGTLAEGVIIGSKYITLAKAGGMEAVIKFTKEVSAALDKGDYS
ncbi:MAG: tryptophan synthase subunit alpha [Anaerolineae bacterium]|nr:tryptophan synthase subunit alpha [Anaerolineae bacterium]